MITWGQYKNKPTDKPKEDMKTYPAPKKPKKKAKKKK